ncbi:bifunctional 5,10-methylene-tetrahydrofolate dehydrogenase/5,10-methylene-tetrahydrofolate cyclohydrolase [Kribbella sp. ALI-6-A]|uniref:bifunctional 5,10-methylenetetrahydrofolate dehydrogenase/5,10-methenyltetrahydrofolate cyclohydrolase n=1 Tax=Kribbella sp. ALI-6-A TaxID=1933817 RepID=UPI00097C94FF|nr:bifunctional 5,10-methylenetetrahydrofolate dehydrogenase/5,10-methenyltetrahydrofolate cyclohydrolase [Kribbella sp. ALI-6-A]ONI78516.1 bifunctional 5,10-methylene-tetrahydrofolate dehydrogenase/5,10-methylene-tetrahydrofolate cyclohydrolase [Kribbella sp. ALI-6-A]
MTAELLDGAAVARKILAGVTERAADFAAAHGRAPCLVTVLVGDDPASHTYVRMKHRRCQQAGIRSRGVVLAADTSTEALVGVVEELSADGSIDGILLQHPVPAPIDESQAFEAIDPAKDVDGVTRASFAAMSLDPAPAFVSCTPGGILRLLDEYAVPIEGRHAVVVGRSPILGKPVGMLLLARHATVTYCHSRTRDLADQVARADIVVAAVGSPRVIAGSWIKPGAVVLDAGYNDGNVGDVDFESALGRAAMLTPVPGGVGPMTIAVLLDQTVRSAQLRAGAS